MKNAKLLKPLALVFIVGAAVIAFGLAGQQALSEGVDGAGNKACGASSDACCSKAKAAAAAQCERGQTCGEAKAASVEKSADLSTKQGRSEAVWAEYKAAQNANCEAAKAEGAACSLKAAADKATCPLPPQKRQRWRVKESRPVVQSWRAPVRARLARKPLRARRRKAPAPASRPRPRLLCRRNSLPFARRHLLRSVL